MFRIATYATTLYFLHSKNMIQDLKGLTKYLRGLPAIKNPVLMAVWIYIGVMFLLAALKLAEGNLSLTAVFAVMGIVVALVLRGTLYLMNWMDRNSEKENQAPAVVPQPPPLVTPPDSPIEMRLPKITIGKYLLYAVSFLIGCIWLLRYPETLWTRWLAYPAALVLLALTGVMLYVTFYQNKERIVADRDGIEVRVAGEAPEKVNWSQVGTVKILKVEAKIKSTSALTRLVGTYFQLLDREGGELLKIDDPLAPSEAYQLFLDCIPTWTGLPVQRETEIRR